MEAEVSGRVSAMTRVRPRSLAWSRSCRTTDVAMPRPRRDSEHGVAELGGPVDRGPLPAAVADQRAVDVVVEEEVDAPRRVVARIEPLQRTTATIPGNSAVHPRLTRMPEPLREGVVADSSERLEPRARRTRGSMRTIRRPPRGARRTAASPSASTPLRANQVHIVITSWWSRSKPCGFWRRSTACGKSIIQRRSRHHSTLYGDRSACTSARAGQRRELVDELVVGGPQLRRVQARVHEAGRGARRRRRGAA